MTQAHQQALAHLSATGQRLQLGQQLRPVHTLRRSQQLLRLVGQGLRNSEIAEQMHLSEATVRTYVSRLLQATNCDSRAQLVAFAYRSGLAFD